MTVPRWSTGLGLAAAALFAAPVAAAAPASAVDAECVFTVVSVRALDVQESGGDEIILRLDGARFPDRGAVTFTARGQVRSAASFDSPVVQFPRQGEDHLFVNVEEDDPIFDDGIGPTLGLSCTAARGVDSFVFEDRTAAYRVTYEVG